jgi:hypothetical protein
MNENPPTLSFSAGENGLTINEPVSEDVETKPSLPPKKEKKPVLIKVIAFVAVTALVAFALTQIDYTAISDNLSSIGFELSPEMQTLVDDLQLTDEGRRILMATRPELQDADDFNQNCVNLDTSSSILGCYSNGSIFIYNISRKELSGIRQVTLAHELLHAVWQRMGRSERSALEASLKSVYDSNAEVHDHLDLYDSSDMYDELHSTIGSQVSAEVMPEDLRLHYQKYFTNQKVLADFYDGYYSVFRQTDERLKTLEADIATHRETLNTMEQNYTLQNAQLTNDINDFNSRARNGGFATLTEFYNERERLLARKTEQQEEYQNIMNYTREANALINEYNSLVVRKNDLYKSIDSNVTAPTDTEADSK